MEIKNKLTSKQYQAASSQSDYLRIIAGAGTGKTRTLSYRIAYLLDQGMLPQRMVAITFTNKAAKEMLDRVTNILQNESDRTFSAMPLISTVSSKRKFSIFRDSITSSTSLIRRIRILSINLSSKIWLKVPAKNLFRASSQRYPV